MTWWNALGGLLQPGSKDRDKDAGQSPQATARNESRSGTALRETARRTEGFDAQEALFRPPREGRATKDKTEQADPTTGHDEAREAEIEAEQAAALSTPEPELPRDFSQESVLGTWIVQFNASLSKQTDRKGRNPKLAKLQGMGWADSEGLNLDLLKAAAATWQPRSARRAKKPKDTEDASATAEAPAPATTAKVLAMLAESNAVLRKVIDKDYPGKCLQFSEKMLVELGAKRADGSKDREKRTAKAGPLTAKYRGKNVKDLPEDLPAGYQICITSMPEWGFTEVGNHWFVSAGGGFYADNTGGIFTGAGMTSNLRKAAAEQWAARVVDKEFRSGYAKVRSAMALKFLEANPGFQRFAKAGRTLAEKEKTTKVKEGRKTSTVPNEAYKDPSALEAEGFAAIKAFVLGNATYHPRIWLVEPTARVDKAS